MKDLAGVTIKTNPWKIRKLAELKRENKLHLPDLQRGFVWAPEKVRALHDSLYRQYPVGALLLWKPTWTGPDVPILTRPWDIWPPNAVSNRGEREPHQPVEPGSVFVLDGQQRLTSLFRVIFRSRARGKASADPDLLVALSPDPDWVENPFWLRNRTLLRKMKDGLLIPAEVLFEGVRAGNESMAVQRAIAEWVRSEESLYFDAFNRANAIRNAILESEIVAYEIDAEAEDENVIEIFRRLNEQGVRLRPGDLAVARLTGEMIGFRERAKEALVHSDLVNFVGGEDKEDRIRTGGFVDTDLLVRTALFLATGAVRYRDIEKRGKPKETYGQVDSVWNDACSGIRAGVNRFRAAGIPGGVWLPYRYLLLSPAIAAAKGHDINDPKWLGWAIAASLWGHYAGQAETTAQADAKAAGEGDDDRLLTNVRAQAKRTESIIPEEDDFTENIVRDGGVLLALVTCFVTDQTRSIPSQKFIRPDGGPLDVHHIFPRALLNSYRDADNAYVPDRLGNLTILDRADNEHLQDTPPKVYLAEIPPEVLASHAIPNDPPLWDEQRYPDFCVAREKLLAAKVRTLLQGLGLT